MVAGPGMSSSCLSQRTSVSGSLPAWLCCVVLAHNLLRWTSTLGRSHPVDRLAVARTVRTHLIAVPGGRLRALSFAPG